MHATTQNVFGVHTEYGTHPKQPRRIAQRARHMAATVTHAVAVGGLAAWFLIKRSRTS